MAIKRKASTYRRRPAKKARRMVRRRPRSPIGALALRLFETKRQEYRETETPINSLTGWYANASSMNITQGVTYATMDGHIIRGKGLSIRGWVKNNATTTQIVRVGICHIKQGASKIPDFYAGTDVLEGNAGNSNITLGTSAARMTQRFNQDQYRIVKHKMFKLGSNSTSDGSDVRTYKFWLPFRGRAFRYDGSAVLPANDVYAVFVINCLGNNDESTGENIEHSFTSTFYYVDP